MLLSKFAPKTVLVRAYAAAAKQWPAVKCPVTKPTKNHLAYDATYGHHPNPTLWGRICLWLCVPALIASSINVFLCEVEHHKHDKHREQEFKPYDYLNVITKPFPWGDGQHSLLHNAKTNHLKDGYTCPKDAGIHHSH